MLSTTCASRWRRRGMGFIKVRWKSSQSENLSLCNRNKSRKQSCLVVVAAHMCGASFVASVRITHVRCTGGLLLLQHTCAIYLLLIVFASHICGASPRMQSASFVAGFCLHSCSAGMRSRSLATSQRTQRQGARTRLAFRPLHP
jgi:hypothetical protein